MWWRIVIVLAVILILAPALYPFFWRFPKLTWFYRKILAFEDTLRPTEQGAHFFFGILALPTFWLLGKLLGLQFIGAWCLSVWPSCSAEGWSVIAALFGALIKEIADVFTDGCWHPHDSIVDVCFWFLGGLTAPLWWWLIYEIVVFFGLSAQYCPVG